MIATAAGPKDYMLRTISRSETTPQPLSKYPEEWRNVWVLYTLLQGEHGHLHGHCMQVAAYSESETLLSCWRNA